MTGYALLRPDKSVRVLSGRRRIRAALSTMGHPDMGNPTSPRDRAVDAISAPLPPPCRQHMVSNDNCRSFCASCVYRPWRPAATTSRRWRWRPAGRSHRPLATICEYGLAEREQRRLQRHTREALLPAGKTMATFDFSAVEPIQRQKLTSVPCDGTWIEQARNPLLFDASGLGKSHIAASILDRLLHNAHRVPLRVRAPDHDETSKP